MKPTVEHAFFMGLMTGLTVGIASTSIFVMIYLNYQAKKLREKSEAGNVAPKAP